MVISTIEKSWKTFLESQEKKYCRFRTYIPFVTQWYFYPKIICQSYASFSRNVVTILWMLISLFKEPLWLQHHCSHGVTTYIQINGCMDLVRHCFVTVKTWMTPLYYNRHWAWICCMECLDLCWLILWIFSVNWFALPFEVYIVV